MASEVDLRVPGQSPAIPRYIGLKNGLPQDPGFQDVRIYSFGYNSDWANESTLSVHDFSKSLLGSLHHCPAMARNSNVRITGLAIEYD